MLNPSTGRISETRDVMWLNTYKWGGHSDTDDPPELWSIEEIDENYEENEKNEKEKEENLKNAKNVTENPTIDHDRTTGGDGDAKLRTARRNLDTWYNPVLNEGGEFNTTESRSLRVVR